MNKPEILRVLWDIVVFQIGCMLLNMICVLLQLLNKVAYIYEFLYKFDTVFYQFLETGTSERTLIGLNLLLRILGFSLYPLLFYLFSPFKVRSKSLTLRFYQITIN